MPTLDRDWRRSIAKRLAKTKTRHHSRYRNYFLGHLLLKIVALNSQG